MLDGDERRALTGATRLVSSPPRRLISILLMGISFCLIFSAFGTTQNYLTKIMHSEQKGDFGYVVLCVVYSVLAASVFVVPSLVRFLGPRLALFIGALGYACFIASFIWQRLPRAVVYAAASVLGLAAALLWVGQGVYLTRMSSSKTRGRDGGIFWTLYQISGVTGNLTGYFLVKEEHRDTAQVFFIVFACIAVAGALLLLTLSKAPDPDSRLKSAAAASASATTTATSSSSSTATLISSDDDNDDASSSGASDGISQNSSNSSNNNSISHKKRRRRRGGGGGVEGGGSIQDNDWTRKSSVGSWRHIYRALKRLNLWLLLPLMTFTGLELSFTSGTFTFMLPRDQIGLVMSAFGGAGIFGGLSFGLLLDRIGRKPVVLIGALCFIAALGGCWAMRVEPEQWPALRFLVASALGLGDSCFNVVVYATVGALFPALEIVAIYTLCQFVQNVGLATGFLVGAELHGAKYVHFGVRVMIVSLFVVLLISTALYMMTRPVKRNR